MILVLYSNILQGLFGTRLAMLPNALLTFYMLQVSCAAIVIIVTGQKHDDPAG
jgi:hypothetical protein